MKDYKSFSLWLETCGDDLTPRPPLDGSIAVDVAILGAGFSGLWTAYYLLQRDASLKVAVIEREIAGFGASGRNGGFCGGGFPLSIGELERRYGREPMLDLMHTMHDTPAEIERVAKQEGIDIDFRRGGGLQIARGTHQLETIKAGFERRKELGLGDDTVWLDADGVHEHVRIDGVLAGTYNPNGAVIHPGKLVRGLARAVERHGGTIYEQTPVTDYEPGPPSPKLITPRGEVRAKAIALCGESYLSQLPKLHRQILPAYSLITATEPLSDAQWAEIGWQRHETIIAPRLSVIYVSRTVDGRILFGGRGAPYHYDSRIEDSYDRHVPTHHMLQDLTRRWFPVLKGIRFTQSWGGPLGVPRDWMPTFAFDERTGVATARGYTGTGVPTTNLAGRILADLITHTDSPITHLPPVGHYSRDWEPEPLRWLGVRYVQRGFLRLDEEAERSGKPPSGKTLVERLGHH